MSWTSRSASSLGLRRSDTYDVWGEVPPAPRVALVGSRAAHRSCRTCVPLLVRAAKACGWSVVSGGARGIDADVHEAALVEDAAQLAVLPCGRDALYPPDHAPLFARLQQAPRSALLCAYPPGKTFGRGMFVSRNALMVALADAVIVVEAQLRSGSMQTGRLALKRARPLGVLFGSPGAAQLVASGAIGLGFCGDEGVEAAAMRWLRGIRGEPSEAHVEAAWPAELSWLEACFHAAGAGAGGIAPGDVPGVLDEVMIAFVEAETLGLIVEASPGRYVATTPRRPRP